MESMFLYDIYIRLKLILTAKAAPGRIPPAVAALPPPPVAPPAPPPPIAPPSIAPPSVGGGMPCGTKAGNASGAAATKARDPATATAPSNNASSKMMHQIRILLSNCMVPNIIFQEVMTTSNKCYLFLPPLSVCRLLLLLLWSLLQ